MRERSFDMERCEIVNNHLKCKENPMHTYCDLDSYAQDIEEPPRPKGIKNNKPVERPDIV